MTRQFTKRYPDNRALRRAESTTGGFSASGAHFWCQSYSLPPGSPSISSTSTGATSDRADGPPAFYKDANPRNFLITPAGELVTIDFDDLTLAPLGDDLAKLVVCLAMTYGPLPTALAAGALAAYNTSAARYSASREVTWPELMNWAEIHYILTSRHAADPRYPFKWDKARPSSPPTGEPAWP
jgi:hypothetical protein